MLAPIYSLSLPIPFLNFITEDGTFHPGIPRNVLRVHVIKQPIVLTEAEVKNMLLRKRHSMSTPAGGSHNIGLGW
ncbi:hypothetical protein XELAEV_18033384mg [Xenopus laevis]|uniref:Uncharacterized protein n=1 Tax=Xenopus laevis TaxID=8355 RepID=A0A974CJ85_XENLA|nr:hypothetical protein XELAEV_18033384mg [Xenopus laevis]